MVNLSSSIFGVATISQSRMLFYFVQRFHGIALTTENFSSRLQCVIYYATCDGKLEKLEVLSIAILYIHHIFTSCSLLLNYMFTVYSLYVYYMFTIYSLYLHYIFIIYSLYVHHIFTICSQYIHCMFTIYEQYVYYIITLNSIYIYLLYVRYIFILCSL